MSNEEKGEGEQKEKRWLADDDDDECFFFFDQPQDTPRTR